MSQVTEIYSCTQGQDIKEGKLDYSHDIATRDEAEIDAIRRCKINNKLVKIVYYAVSESGSFRSIYSHKNENAAASGKKQIPAGKPRKPGKRKVKKVKKSFFEKVVSSLTGR